MIVPDANLLIYAVNERSPFHEPARIWIEELLEGNRPVGLAWTVALAFLRVTTRPGVFESPLTVDEALSNLDDWLSHPRVRILTPTEGHWGVFQGLLRAAGTAGNLTSDAHLAAIAIEHAATVASADNDFRRFPGLDYFNPLA